MVDELDKKIGKVLIQFYEEMNKQTGSEASGKQATLIIMAINDMREIIDDAIQDRLYWDAKNEH